MGRSRYRRGFERKGNGKMAVMSRCVQQGVCAIASLALCGVSLPATADYTFYDRNDTRAAFSLDLVAAGFYNPDSWFGEAESFVGTDTDGWMEFGAEAGVSFETALGPGSLYGALSGLYTTTEGDDASGTTVDLDDTDDFTREQGHLGWRTDDVFSGLANDTVSISIGRQDYSIGTGIVVSDGSGDGGHRGGWYIGMREVFPESVILRLQSDELLLEAFTLENDPRRGGTNGEASGVNAEYDFGDKGTIGGSYLYVDARLPAFDEIDVYSVRAELEALDGLSLSGEYVREESSDIEANGYYAQGSYEFQRTAWTPALTYRFAHFDGDDLGTDTDEQFREIAYGHTDYGYWVQGEITGNYPLGNGNLVTHMLRAKVTPFEGIATSLLYYDFSLDQKQIFGDPVTSDDWGAEINLTVDWAATDNVEIIGVLGTLMPGDAAEEWVGGDDDWRYLMLYVSYAL
jgi:hypothetical protein